MAQLFSSKYLLCQQRKNVERFLCVSSFLFYHWHQHKSYGIWMLLKGHLVETAFCRLRAQPRHLHWKYYQCKLKIRQKKWSQLWSIVSRNAVNIKTIWKWTNAWQTLCRRSNDRRWNNWDKIESKRLQIRCDSDAWNERSKWV